MTEIDDSAEAFISRWQDIGGGERANYQMFLTELCNLIGTDSPNPATGQSRNDGYVFERKIIAHGDDDTITANYIDLYKRGCFVLEAKQSRKRLDQTLLAPAARKPTSKRWDTVMRQAREQAEAYARRLPTEEGWPPFLVVVDVGRAIELYADFSLQGKYYAQFPDRMNHRIALTDLHNNKTREILKRIWEDPLSLDPTRQTAEVTRSIAGFLAKLSAALEARLCKQYPPPPPVQPGRVFSLDPIIAEKVAIFLIRCLFTMFAASVKLLPERAFVDLLERHRGKANRVHHALERLWRDMDVGHYSTELASDLLHFNGGIFHNSSAIPLEEDELELLIVAARRDWKHVEPAIFGTLLERALSDSERSRLGAHYTPRPYVERLVIATIIDPLHEDWRVVQATAAKYQNDGLMDKAREVVGRFHKTLCELRILDPACGTGNFLYVAMELLKRLEGEVLDLLIKELHGEEPLKLTGHTIDPHQFLGLEINPRAVAIAELVLWIGHLQWHFRTHGNALPSEPVLRKFSNINRQDAILAHDGEELERDAAGKPLTRWDGVTYKTHPITGENIPDEDARVERKRYRRPRMAEWPEADFVVGNPPFIGGKDIRQELSDGYAEACWEIRPHIPGGADFVMHFWDKAADLLRLGKIRRFGLITTNSITQTFSRRVIERHMQGKHPLRLRMAIPDHPWVKGADRAAVRIAMTVADLGQENGLLREVIAETDLDTDTPLIALREREGRINADLSIGADTIAALPLKANEKLCSRGVSLHGAGFIVTPGQAQTLGLGKTKGLDRIIVPYRNGRDLTARPRDVMVIDAFGLSDDELRKAYPSVYQWLSDHVRPERDHNNRASYRDSWWTFGEPRRELRTALQGLKRYIATVETAKHRVFQFLDGTVRPDNRLVCFALEDAFYLGVLSSHIHVKWTLHVGGLLEDRPIYTKTLCFDPFPFPTTNAAQRQQIGAIAEQIDNHRKTVLARHKHLTLTGLYNVLEQVKAGAELSAAEQDIYQAGLVGVLRDLHIDLDRAVAAAYGWPTTLSSEAILERLVALNRARAEEERSGLVHWLRPDFQSDGAALPRGLQLEVPLAAAAERKPKLPDELPDRVRVVRDYLRQREQAVSVGELARAFSQGGRAKGTLEDILLTLTMLGQADRMGDRYRLTNWR